jgi:FtsZ-binding cell division protein ZapB
MRQENQALAAKTKDMDDMKKNVIRLTSQLLREADNLRLNQGELDDLKLRINICEAEKQQLQSRVEELERHNSHLRENLQETDRLRKENRALRVKVNELDEVHSSVEILRKEIQEGELLRQKLLKIQGIEKVG